MERIIPDWPAPKSVTAFTTTRDGGVSDSPFHSLNLSLTVGDDEEAVRENRTRLSHRLPEEPRWLRQSHSSRLLAAEDIQRDQDVADAAYTFRKNIVCAVLTADCLPIVLCGETGRAVAAIHAGWRGLAGGVIANTAAAMTGDGALMAWIGPAIGGAHYPVGREVLAALNLHADPEAGDEPHLDIAAVAQTQLQDAGVRNISRGELCTYSDRRFYSARRQARTGRMATVIFRD